MAWFSRLCRFRFSAVLFKGCLKTPLSRLLQEELEVRGERCCNSLFEFVGEVWLGKIAERVKAAEFDRFTGPKTAGLSFRQFCSLVQGLDGICWNHPLGAEPVENRVSMFTQTQGDFLRRHEPAPLPPGAKTQRIVL